MALTGLDHCAIRTGDLAATRDFYVDVLGLEDGDRPPFAFPGHWLYIGGRPVVHLIGLDKDGSRGLVDYMGEDRNQALTGTGAVDHLAFTAGDLDGMRRNLKKLGVDTREREVPDLHLHQIFVVDPNGVTVEINFPTK